MEQGYGIAAHAAHQVDEHRAPARYLVIIDAGGTMVARLFLATRQPVAEFDAGSEEVAVMTQGLAASRGADGPEWDEALAGHNRHERAAADVYALDV